MKPEFIVVALPRSRTAWLANFLTTNETFCLHDPVGIAALGESLDDGDGRMLGWADTAIGMHPERCNAMQARNVVIHRDVDEVIASVERLGVMGAAHSLREQAHRMKEIRGLHIPYRDIDANLDRIWLHCTAGLFFDASRAAMLKTLKIELTASRLARFAALLREAA